MRRRVSPVFVLLAAVAGCSTPGDWGDDAGAGGTSGRAGSGGRGGKGIAGSTGAAGRGEGPAVSPLLITDFGGGPSLVSGPFWGAGQGWALPTVDTSVDRLHITLDSGPSTGMYPYAYVGLPLNDAPVAAPAGTSGVMFTVSGALSEGCLIQYSTVDQDHLDVTNLGHCAAADGCYPSSRIFTLSVNPTRVRVAWEEQTGGVGVVGAPSAVNPAQLLDVMWQIQTLTGAIDASCTADVVIDDVWYF